MQSSPEWNVDSSQEVRPLNELFLVTSMEFLSDQISSLLYYISAMPSLGWLSFCIVRHLTNFALQWSDMAVATSWACKQFMIMLK